MGREPTSVHSSEGMEDGTQQPPLMGTCLRPGHRPLVLGGPGAGLKRRDFSKAPTFPSYGAGFTMVLLSKATAPIRTNALPFSEAPVFSVMA